MITAPPSFGTVLSGFLTQLKCAPAFLLLLSPFVALSLEHPPLGTCLLSGHRSRCINLSLGGQYLRFVTLPRRGSSVIRCRNFPGRETCPLLELENEHPATGQLYKNTYPYCNSIQCILHWRGTLNTPPPSRVKRSIRLPNFTSHSSILSDGSTITVQFHKYFPLF